MLYTTPDPPGELTVNWVDGEGAVLNWTVPGSDGVEAVTGYEYRHKAGGGSFGDWTGAGAALTATVPGVSDGASDTYEVRARSGSGAGPAAAFTTPAPPGPPQDLSVSLAGGVAALSWAPPLHNGGASITGYEHRHREGRGGDFGAWTSAGTGASATVPGLTDGTYNVFEVRALNSQGAGAASSSVLAAIRSLALVNNYARPEIDLLILEDDTIVVRSHYESPHFGVRVHPVPGVSIGSMELKLTGPLSHTRTDNGPPWSLFGNGPYGHFIGKHLPVGRYTLRVTAYEGQDLGGAQLDVIEVRFTMAADTPAVPGAPGNLSVNWAGGQAALSWDTPADRGGLPLDGYQYRYKTGGGSFGDWTGADSGSAAAISGVADGAANTYEVRARNQLGHGAAASLAAPVAPGPPQSAFASLDGGAATLTWVAPAHNGGASVTGYEYRYRADSDAAFGPWTSVGTSLTATVSGLSDGTLYRSEVRAENSAGAGIAGEAATEAILGLTLVDARPRRANEDLLALADGAAIVLSDYYTSTFALRADPVSGVSIGSMELELSGPLAHTQTENHLPYSLFGDQAFAWTPSEDLNGRSLPAGSYTLAATAYSGRDLGGHALDTLEVGFTVLELHPISMHQHLAPGSSGAPQDLVATLDGADVLLSWDPPADTGNSAVHRLPDRGLPCRDGLGRAG